MKHKKLWLSIVTGLLLLITSIGVYASYPTIYKSAQSKEDKSPDISRAIYDHIFMSNFVLANTIDIQSKDAQNPRDKYLSVQEGEALTKAQASGKYNDDMKNFNQWFVGWNEQTRGMKNVRYFAKNTITGGHVSNDTRLNPATFGMNAYKEYRWYMKVSFDAQGVPTYHQIRGNLGGYEDFTLYAQNIKPETYASERFESNHEVDEYGNEISSSQTISYKMPTNMEYIYAIPMKIVDKDSVYGWYSFDNVGRVTGYALPYLFLALGVVMLYMLCMPLRYAREMRISKTLIKIKAAFIMVWYVIAASLLSGMGHIILPTQNGSLLAAIKEVGMGSFASAIMCMLNVAIIMFILGTAMFAIFHIKYIFSTGIGTYLRQHTLVGWCINAVRRIVRRTLVFDLQNPLDRKIGKLVLINLVVVFMLITLAPLGLFLSIIYSIMVFVMARDKMKCVQNDYDNLLKSTKKLSQGDFNVELKESLGLFSSLGNEFGNIKEGFKKAVDEEVISQKMKSELVSNVSHDLKTPLTSIITYVDLLKKEDISTEARAQYVDTLDRNSQRLKTLIEDLFEMSKVNSGEVKATLVEVDVVSLVKQTLFECENTFSKVALDVKISVSDEKIYHPLDSAKTYRIFENLLVNIGKYALPSTRVYIDIEAYESGVRIVFKNISAQEINVRAQDIVARFTRGDASRNSEGSGLGLAIVQSFTQLQNGQFSVDIDGDLFKATVQFDK